MDRRDFLKKSAMGIAGAIVGGSIIGGLAGATAACTPATQKKRIGLQVYSLRQAMREDPKATLTAVAAMGFSEIETADYNEGKVYGMTPAEFRTFVEGLGMKVSSCHIGSGPVKDDAWWAQAIADHKAMGCRYIVIPSFRVGATVEELDATCAYFNKVAAMCKAQGIIFAYHNHAAEYRTIGETTDIIYDYLLTHTTNDVSWEMDVFWTKAGGCDPVEYLKKYPGRFPLLHIKDESIIGESGTIDFGPIFEAAYAQGMKDYYVEVERYSIPDPMVCVQKSYEFLDVAPYVK